MILTPEVVLLGDHTMSRVRWTLDREVERIEGLIESEPELQQLVHTHGWTARSMAWGHIIAGLMDAAGFDDERGRT